VPPYSLAIGIAETRTLIQLEAPSSTTSSLRQPPVAATETAAAQGLTLAPNVVDTPTRGTRSAPSVPARPSSSLRSLSPPVLSLAYDLEQPESVHHRTGRAATQRVASPRARSQRAPSLSPSHSTFSYGAPSPPLGLDIGVEYPAARPLVFQPKSLGAADVDRTYPAAASVDVSTDVGHMPLPYTDDVCWPGSVTDPRQPRPATGPRQPESATSGSVRVHSVAAAQSTSVDVASTFASAPTSAFMCVQERRSLRALLTLQVSLV